MRTYYYYQALRKTITQFLDIFNDIKIKRYDENGVFTNHINVPIKFAPKERAYYYIFENHQDEMLPMISVTMNSVSFANDRMGSNYHILTKASQIDAGIMQRFLNPVPYNLGFTVFLWTKYMADVDQILEQILAYFAPHIFIRIYMPEVDFFFDVKVVFAGASPDISTDLGEEERRIIKYTMDFTVQTYLFRPVEDYGLIKQIFINYYTNEEGWAEAFRDTTSMFSSAASGESQVFTGISPYLNEEDEKIYTYEIFQFGERVGPPIPKIIMPGPPRNETPEGVNGSVNLGYSDLISETFETTIGTGVGINLGYSDLITELSDIITNIICMGYDSETLAIQNFSEEISVEFNISTEDFEIESGKYLAVTENLSPSATYDLRYNAISDNPFTLELYKEINDVSTVALNRTSNLYWGRLTYGTWVDPYWIGGLSGGNYNLWLRTSLAPDLGEWSANYFPNSMRINFSTAGSNTLTGTLIYTPRDPDGYDQGLFTLYTGPIVNNEIISLDWSSKDGDDPAWEWTYYIRRLHFSMPTDNYQINSIEFISEELTLVFTLHQSWDANLVGETYTIENATSTITTSASSFYTILENTHDSCSVISITPSASIVIEEGDGGDEEELITQNFETAQEAMVWAEENLTHDGYNTEEDVSVMSIGSGAWGAIYYYNLNNGSVWDGEGSTLKSTDASSTDDIYWASYIKTGLQAYSEQWSSPLEDIGTTTYNITPWHWSQSCFVIRNDGPTTLTFNVKLVSGEIIG